MTYRSPTMDVATRQRETSRFAQQGGAQQARRSDAQVPSAERWTALAAGSIAALLGLSHRGLPGLLVTGVGAGLLYHGATGRSLIGVPLGADAEGDAAESLAQHRRRLARRGVTVKQAFTIGRSREDCYRFWRDFTNLPQIMSHLEEVRVLDDKRSRWVAKSPTGGTLEWDAEMTNDVPNERISWQSLPGADVDNAGTVRFEDSPRGTVTRISMRYVAPAGRLGSWISTLLGENPDRVIREDLRNFKRVMEIGEVLTIQGQPRGTCTGHGKLTNEWNRYAMPPTV